MDSPNTIMVLPDLSCGQHHDCLVQAWIEA
ncbi:hypothetical protein SAMN05216215_10788 [Saccharopolyspora shandongensis]|uniref:Uncharacterized protein n=1 Tax=Saccharopolyspora shandongensis TaxID=418495 RepID=A0A1H3TC31_9PSEU|nr:hypothetical protein SAMN05216215_10788 [Saccharopolyspora shandongensis]